MESPPPCSPELNLAEVFWRWMKRRCANRAFKAAWSWSSGIVKRQER
ncbi:transposase [Halomonas lactosivorans]